VYQRKSDGRRVASVDLGYVNGKRKRLIAYRDTRREAAAALDDLKRQARSHARETPEIRTVGQYLAHWLDSVVTKTLAPKTVESYRGAIENHILPVIGAKRLTKLEYIDVQRMLDLVAAKETAGPRTVQNVRAVLSAAFNDGIKKGMVASNPAEHTTIARVIPKERSALTVDQASRLFNEVAADRFEALYMIAAVYGLRRGECLGLRWSDIDMDAREIRVRQQVILVNNRPTITQLKTRASRRTLPLLDDIEAALERRRERQQEERLLAGRDWQEYDLIFASMVGTPYQPANLQKKWHTYLELAGLPDVPFHSLRHTAASFLVALNVHPRHAMEILGHTNMKTTMEIYSHAQQAGMREALESVENVLRRAKT
jgi:integrase